jgi:hypothetical protein
MPDAWPVRAARGIGPVFLTLLTRARAAVLAAASGHEDRAVRRSTLRSRKWLGVLLSGLATVAVPSALCQTPPAAPPGQAGPSAPADTDALARYVPQDKLIFYLEFQGLDAHANAWGQTAASRILTETKTGAMLDEVLTQLHAQLTAGQGNPTTSGEELAMLKHLLRSGMVFAVRGDQRSGAGVIVFRDAFRDDVKPMFAMLIGKLKAPDSTPQVSDKPGGRRIVSMTMAGPGGQSLPVAWWVEARRDLVITFPPPHADEVIAALDGGAANASGHARRARLARAEGGFQPIGFGFLELSAAPPLPPEVAKLGLDGVRAIEMQWGAEGKALRSVVEVEAPRPRKGVLALLEQPTFDARAIPALPEETDGFGVVSIDPDATLTKLADVLGQLGQADASAKVADLEKSFHAATKLDLRKDVLEHLGPKVAFYTVPNKKGGLGAALNAFNPLAGLQVPRFVALVEVKDEKAMNKSLTQLMKWANTQLAELFPAPPETNASPGGAGGPSSGVPGGRGGYPGAGGQAGRGGSGGGTAATKKAAAMEFRMTATSPITYQLTVPPQFAMIFQAKPTIALGPKHLVIAAGPDLASQALKQVEEAESWTPSGDFADAVAGLPADLVMLMVSDPRDTEPQAIANLPTTLQNALAALPAAMAGAPGMPPQGAAGAPGFTPGGPPGGGRGPQGVSPPGAGGAEPGMRRGPQGAPPPGAEGAGPGPRRGPQGNAPSGGNSGGGPPPGYPGASGGGYPGASGGGYPGASSGGGPPAAPGAAPGRLTIQVPPEKVPTADSIRPLLFPGAAWLTVDDRGIRLVSREAFFDFAGLSAALNGLGMARLGGAGAAGMAAGPPGMAPPGPPGAAPPGAPGAGASGGGTRAARPDCSPRRGRLVRPRRRGAGPRACGWPGPIPASLDRGGGATRWALG